MPMEEAVLPCQVLYGPLDTGTLRNASGKTIDISRIRHTPRAFLCLRCKVGPNEQIATQLFCMYISFLCLFCQASDLRSISASVSSGMALMSAPASSSTTPLSSNRSSGTEVPTCLFRFFNDWQIVLLSPARGLYASPGMPCAMIS